LILDDNTLAYTDVVPGTVTEKCPERSARKVSLRPTGIIHFNNTCQYTVTNGPFQRSQVPKFVELIFNKFLHELDLTREDKDSILGEHWQDNGPYYMFAVIAALVLTILLFALYCYRYGQRTRRMRMPSFPFGRRNERREMEINLQPLAPSVERALVSLINA
jgi:hypothetical protein